MKTTIMAAVGAALLCLTMQAAAVAAPLASAAPAAAPAASPVVQEARWITRCHWHHHHHHHGYRSCHRVHVY
jgi:hypothetical protein